MQSIDRRGFLIASGLAAAAAGSGRLSHAGIARQAGGSGGAAVLPWREVAPGVRVVADAKTGGNTALFSSEGHGLVVDSKLPAFGEAIRVDAGTLAGPAPSGLGTMYLLNTHHHGDHTGGNDAFVRAGVPVAAHPRAIERIAQQTDRYKQGAAGGVEMARGAFPDNERLAELARAEATLAERTGPDGWLPRIGVAGGSSFRVGSIPVELHHFGAGHTDNDLVVRAPTLNVVHTGDLVFNGRHPYFDPPGGTTVRGWIRSLERLLALCDADTVVIPGHGPVGGVAAVEAQLRYMHKIVDVVQRSIDAGVSKQGVQERTYGFMRGLDADSIRPRALGAVYDELRGE